MLREHAYGRINVAAGDILLADTKLSDAQECCRIDSADVEEMAETGIHHLAGDLVALEISLVLRLDKAREVRRVGTTAEYAVCGSPCGLHSGIFAPTDVTHHLVQLGEHLAEGGTPMGIFRRNDVIGARSSHYLAEVSVSGVDVADLGETLVQGFIVVFEDAATETMQQLDAVHGLADVAFDLMADELHQLLARDHAVARHDYHGVAILRLVAHVDGAGFVGDDNLPEVAEAVQIERALEIVLDA